MTPDENQIRFGMFLSAMSESQKITEAYRSLARMYKAFLAEGIPADESCELVRAVLGASKEEV